MKNVFKRFLSIFLVVAIMSGMFSGTFAYAAENDKAPAQKISQEVYAKWKQNLVSKNTDKSHTLLSTANGTISSSYIECFIHEDGGFNIGTVDGDCLLFAYPDGNTSETLIRIDSVDYFFRDYVTNITFSSDRKSVVATATIDGVLVTQTLSIVANPNSKTQNVISIKYDCKNNSSSSKKIGIRIMMDTMLHNNDGAPFMIKGKSIEREVEYLGNNVPQVYQAVDSLTNPSLTATGYFYYAGDEKPDKVQFAYWGQIQNSSWNFQINPSRYLTDDSAVAAYFYEKSVAPGTSRTAKTYYGAYQQDSASQYEAFHYDNNTYNPALAEMCARFSAYAYEGYKYLAPSDIFYDTKNDADKDTNKNDRSKVLNDALSQANFRYIEPHNYADPTEDSATYTFASKRVNHNGTVRDLVIIVIRGTNDVQWKGNMNVTGKSYASQAVHNSFKAGADDIKAYLLNYLNNHKDVENPMILITGHSRGGALGNLLAVSLTNSSIDRYDASSVYAYLFAVPNVSTSYDISMSNIYNFCLVDDFVPSMPLRDWGYGKNGKTFTATADDLTSSDFIVRTAISVENTEGFNKAQKRTSFDKAQTKDVITHVSEKWATVNQYYNKKTTSVIAGSLYEFMHDTVAPAAMSLWNVGSVTRLLEAKLSSEFKKIANFFTDGLGSRASVNDTHQMFTYYNALKTGAFATPANVSNTVNSTAQNRVVANNIELEQAALKTFANTSNNLELLGWNPEDPSTWTGITFDDTGRIVKIDLYGLGLSGSLDLTSFNCLTKVDVGDNNLTGLILPEAATSALSWLDCGYNQLTALDITGQPLELLICNDNHLDKAALEAAAASIPYTSYENQTPATPIPYSDADCTILRNRVLSNSELWDTSAAPETWINVSWVEDNGTYYVEGLDLTNCSLSGKLDVSGLGHLKYLNCSDNAFTSIDASGCNQLASLSCSNNALTDITISASADLYNLICSGNYLSKEEISSLGAELVVNNYQGVQANSSSFCDDELSVLEPIAQALGYDSTKPGEWLFASWTNKGGVYHAEALDFSGISALTGTLDLSGFEYLQQILCGSTGIESAVLPDHMTALNAYSFYNCANLQSIRLPANLTEIEEYAFSGCAALAFLEFPDSLKKIGANAFELCDNLQRVYFPESLVEIGSAAFLNCANLSAAYFTGNAPVCGDDVFMYATVDFTVYHLPETTGWDHDAWNSNITDTFELFSILTYPDKTTYQVGETFDATGLTLQLVNKDGTYQIVDTGYTISGDNTNVVGLQIVAVSYQGHTAEFEIAVNKPAIENADIFYESYQEYTGNDITPEVEVEYNGEPLTEGEDYILYYSNNLEPGMGFITIEGINEYAGSITYSFFIHYDAQYTVTDWTKLESNHPYSDFSEISWTYQASSSDTESITITFDEQTYFEEDWDNLDIYDSDGVLFESYTGEALSGKTVSIPGNSFTLTLITNEWNADWGFKVVDLQENKKQTDSDSVPVFRLYNPYTYEHLLTSGVAERDSLVSIGWHLDGVAWHAPKAGEPVYRLYNPYDDWHTYTMDENEKNDMEAVGWMVDGVISSSAPKETGTPIYRLFNPYEQKNFHLFTADTDEMEFLVSLGWKLEGIAWYAE